MIRDRKLSLMFSAATTLIEGRKFWEGSPASLKSELEKVAKDVWHIAAACWCNIWPKDISAFGRALSRITPELGCIGIDIERGYIGNSRVIGLRRRGYRYGCKVRLPVMD